MKDIHKRRLNLKKKLQKREKIFAAWTSLSHPSITEIFTKIGVDFVGIDIEHSTINQEQSQRIIAASQAGGKLCLPRVASHNMEMIERLLDSGADGIIVPMVNTIEEAKQIVSWCKYPPSGRRSFGIARAHEYGFDFANYAQKWNTSSSLIVQIESITGVENIDQILSLKEVDGAMIGPYDLSSSLGVPGELNHPNVFRAEKKVIETCIKYRKSCGTQIISPDIKTVEKAFSAGYTFVVLASDVFLLWEWSEKMNKIVNKIRYSKS